MRITITRRDNTSTVIPWEIIKSHTLAEEKIDTDSTDFSATDFTLTIDNDRDSRAYDPRTENGFFYSDDWYNATFEVYDDILKTTIFVGRCKTVNLKDADNSIIIYATNLVRDMVDISCIAWDQFGTLTPAGIIYNLLVDKLGMNIPKNWINNYEFAKAISYQQNRSIFMNIAILKDNQKSCLDVIKEICRITNTSIYITCSNVVGLWMWEEYLGAETGLIIEDKHIIPASYAQSTNPDHIQNDFTIRYWSGTALGVVTGSDAQSIAKYSIKSFNVPDSDTTDATAATDFPVILYGITGATACGNLAINRNKTLRQTCSLSLSKDIAENVHVNTLLSLNFDNWIMEPVRVINYKISDDKTADVTCEFLNIPARINRSKARPEKPSIVAVTGTPGILHIYFSGVSQALGYKVNLTANGETITYDYKIINASGTQKVYVAAEAGTEYSITVQSYLPNLILSHPSDVYSAKSLSGDVDQSYYLCDGDPIINGIMSSSLNDNAPTGPLFDNYDSIYISQSLKCSHKVVSIGTTTDITIFAREYNQGWQSWYKHGEYHAGVNDLIFQNETVQLCIGYMNQTNPMKVQIVEVK
jgi:hypothetical protein